VVRNWCAIGFLCFGLAAVSPIAGQSPPGSTGGISVGKPKDDRPTKPPFILVHYAPWVPDVASMDSPVTIIIRAVFASDGMVRDVHLWKVSPKRTPQDIVATLTKITIAAAEKDKFVPATKDTKAVSTCMQLEYVFTPAREGTKPKYRPVLPGQCKG
jgi:hypothetical protein